MKPVDEYTKLSVPKKMGYACGDFACNMSWSLVSSYLVFYLTDIALINATVVGVIIFLSKFWDAVNDPVVGALADRTNTRWGRYRPWIIFAFIPMLIFNVLTFTTNLEWSETMRTWWGLGMYFILVLLYTMVNVTYSAMPALMTRDTETRSALSSYRMTGAFLAMVVLSFATIRIVNATGGGPSGYQRAAMIFSLIAAPFFIITILSSKEIVQVDMEKSEKVSFIQQFKVLKGNWPVIQIAIAYLGWGIIQGGMTFCLYFCTYNAGNDLLYANTQTVWSVCGMIGAFSVSYQVSKVKNKGTLGGIAFSIVAVCSIVSFFLPIESTAAQAIYYVLQAGVGIGSGMMLGNVFGMMPDTAEYTYHKYGVYCAGFVSTVINFMLKVGQAFAISGAAVVLDMVGFVPNAEQTSVVLFTMNFGSHMFVGLCAIVLPAVLGHEGSGVVVEVGPDVTEFKVGDRVGLTFGSCGKCHNCMTAHQHACENMNAINFGGVQPDGTTRLSTLDGKPLSTFFAQSSFATYAIANESNAVKVPYDDIGLALIGPMGCGIQTGAGAVLNRLRPEFGSSIAVFGCGTVGMSAIMAAKIAGCEKIIAVGGNPKSLELARELGATHTINRKEVDDIVGTIRNEITDGGVNYAIDTSGVPDFVKKALASCRFMGTAVVLGATGDVTFNIQAELMGDAKSLIGVLEGDSIPKVFIPKLLDYYKKGMFPFDKLIKFYPFEQINEAFEESGAGKCIKAVLRMD